MRIEGWEIKLNDHIGEYAGRDFKWGETDCLIFSSDWCVICCGVDPMSAKKKTDPETIRGQYSSEEEAKALIRSLRKSTRDIMDIHFERIKPQFAQRGDIVLHRLAFGVVIGRGYAMFNTEDKGLLRVKLEDCNVGWRVEKR